MSVLPPGSWAVVKAGEVDGEERFVVLLVDPDRVTRPGYMWTEVTQPLSADSMRVELREKGQSEAQIDELLQRARKTEQTPN